MIHALSMRLTGFIASLILSIIAYFIIVHPDFFHMDNQIAVISIFVLALIQALVQLFFFINVWEEKGPLWNLGIFISTILIIFIIVYFSIWIIDSLNYHMTP